MTQDVTIFEGDQGPAYVRWIKDHPQDAVLNRTGDTAKKQDQYEEPSGGHGPSSRRSVHRGLIEERDEAHREREQGKDR
jgi:hypothetical protein